MGLFKQSKKDEIGDSVLEEGGEDKVGQKKLFKKKDFKDLNTDNKKTRREPKKPWGRSERMMVLIVIAITAGISGYLWLTSLGWKTLSMPEIEFSNLNIFTEETIVFENDKK